MHSFHRRISKKQSLPAPAEWLFLLEQIILLHGSEFGEDRIFSYSEPFMFLKRLRNIYNSNENPLGTTNTKSVVTLINSARSLIMFYIRNAPLHLLETPFYKGSRLNLFPFPSYSMYSGGLHSVGRFHRALISQTIYTSSSKTPSWLPVCFEIVVSLLSREKILNFQITSAVVDFARFGMLAFIYDQKTYTYILSMLQSEVRDHIKFVHFPVREYHVPCFSFNFANLGPDQFLPEYREFAIGLISLDSSLRAAQREPRRLLQLCRARLFTCLVRAAGRSFEQAVHSLKAQGLLPSALCDFLLLRGIHSFAPLK